MATQTSSYDVIIVGAGSAGIPLASRLSENPGRRVLLLEAGRHYENVDDYPPELSSVVSQGATIPGFPDNWGFVGHLTPQRPYPMPRGKVVGGSSAINGTVFVRPGSHDFDEWASL